MKTPLIPEPRRMVTVQEARAIVQKLRGYELLPLPPLEEDESPERVGKVLQLASDR